MVDQNASPPSPPIEKLFAPLLRAILAACAARLPPGAKAPLTHRPLVWLAWLALAVSFGLGHLVTPELHIAASRAARRPGRKGKTPEGQASLLDLVPTTSDGLPGVYVSDVRLRVGNVRETCGVYELDLFGCHARSTAVAKAESLGWGVIPELRGLRFLPPTVCALITNDTEFVTSKIDSIARGARLLSNIDRPPITFYIKPSGHHGLGDFGPDSFGGSDEGSHYMSQERVEPPDDMLTHDEAKAVIEQSSHSYEPRVDVDKSMAEFRAKSNAQLVKNEEPDARPPKHETMVRAGRMSGKSTSANAAKPNYRIDSITVTTKRVTKKPAKKAKGRKS